jgi:hypothetical protein
VDVLCPPIGSMPSIGMPSIRSMTISD